MRYVLMDVLEEHLDEASFLWSQRERSLVAPNRVLVDVAELEERLLAHVDGLVLAGTPAIENLLRPALEEGVEERAAVAVYTLLGLQEPAGTEVVRTALETVPPEVLPALQNALEAFCSITGPLPGECLIAPHAEEELLPTLEGLHSH